MKTLTIAVPTYNSEAEHILEAFESLARQVAAYPDRVKVVVVDNGSDSKSAEHLASYAQRFPQFGFVRHDENLGYDRNIVRLLDSVDTDFVWFFGDDDLLLAFALDEVIAALDATPDAQIVLCRAQFFHETPEVVDRSSGFAVAPRVLNGTEFIPATAFTAAALSTFCVSTEAMRSSDLGFGLGTSWVHFGALIVIASKVPPIRSIFIDDALVAVRRSNSARWFSNFGNQYQTGLGMVTLSLSGLAHGVDRSIYEFFVARRFATNHIDILTLAWPLTWAKRRQLQAEAKLHFSRFPRFWLLDTPLLFTPNWLKASLSAAIRALGRAKRRLTIRGTAK